MNKKLQKPAKPVKPIHQRLKTVWWLWLMVSVAYPLALAMTTDASLMMALVMQLIFLIPALLFTPALVRGNEPSKLIYLSIVMLIYLGVAGVLALIRYYESAPTLVWLLRLVETGLLFMVNYYLFVLLRRLPPMHKQRK